MRGWISALGLVVLVLVMALVAGPARAWDPSTTHMAMVDRGVLQSALHLRWMEGSGLQRGIFSPLRIDPKRLSEAERRLLRLAFRQAHAASGARGLGGPGACPGAGAPPATRAHCVEGDLWEMTAIGWIRLGVIAELVPRAREAHHFLDLEHPSARTWRDAKLPATALRARQTRSNGAPLAGLWTRTNFGGGGSSAIDWLGSDDPLSPATLRQHLERATFASEREARDHHLALGLVCVGALLHVMQDLAVPAHARGDATAFFAQLSSSPGDRGLPLQELVRAERGRSNLPTLLPLAPRDAALERGRAPVAKSLLGHILGEAKWEGLAHFAGRRFLSETTMPRARNLETSLAPERAAAQLLEGATLDPSETRGARLAPWPADRGYIRSSTGRALAAFDRDSEGRIRPYLDRAVYRDQALQLLPVAVETSRSIVDLLWPAWPQMTYVPATGILELDLRRGLQKPVMTVVLEGPDGNRKRGQRIALRGGQRNRIVRGVPPKPPKDHVVVLVLEATSSAGEPVIIEHALDLTGTRATPPPAADSGRVRARPVTESDDVPSETDDAPAPAPESEDSEPEPEPAPDAEPTAPGDSAKPSAPTR